MKKGREGVREENPGTIFRTKMDQNGQAYQSVCGLFGGSPRVFRYYDQKDEVSVDLLIAEDSPGPGRNSYSTLGLMHHPAGMREDALPLRLELAGGCLKKYEYFPNLLSACAFELMCSRISCRHGCVGRDMVRTYVQFSPMQHILFYRGAGLWKESLPALRFPDKKVIWMTVLPLSDGELSFLEENGPEMTLFLLRDKGADLFDWGREPVI